MKLYMAVIDDMGHTYSKVVTGEPIDLLKRVFICLPTTEFDLDQDRIAGRVGEVALVFSSTLEGTTDPIKAIDTISRVLTHKPRHERNAEALSGLLMMDALVNDGPELVTFLLGLREVFMGLSYSVESMSETQNTIICRIEM